MVDFVALVTPPILAGPDMKPANGDIYVRSTNTVSKSGMVVEPFQAHGIIEDGKFMAKDRGPLYLVVTPEGVALEILAILRQDAPNGQTDKYRISRTVSTPNQSTVTWDALLDTVPVESGTEYAIPSWVQPLLLEASNAGAVAIAARDEAIVAAGSVPTDAEISTTITTKVADGLAAKLDKTEAATTYAPRGIYENFAPENFRKFRAALARQRAGGAVARIGVYGDSNSNGYQAADTTALYSRGFAARAREILNTEFGPSRDGIIFTRIGGANGKADQRFVLNAGWSQFESNTQGPAGSGSIQGINVTASTFDFTLPNVNTFTVYMPRYSSGPTAVDVWIDNEAATTVNAQGAEAMLAVTVSTATVGTHTLRLKVKTTGVAYVNAVEGYDSTTPAIAWTAVGVSGGRASDFNNTFTQAYASKALLFGPSVPAPDLIFINLSINSHNSAEPEATYKAAMTTLINNSKAVADVVLIASAAGGNGSTATWPDYLKWQRDLAATHGCGLINMQARWGPYATANAAPYLLWKDPDHPTNAGYWDLGQATADAVRLAAGRSG